MPALFSRAWWGFTRIRVLVRAINGIGWAATFQLLRRRIAAAFGQTADTLYRITVPGYRWPVCLRGGNSSDGFAFHQLLVMKDLDILSDMAPPRLIIDAGANIGMASLYLLNKYPSVKIVAVEPDPDTFQICNMNLAPFQDRLVLVNGAVWSNCGRLVFARNKVEWNSHVRDTKNILAAVGHDGRPVEPVAEIDVECFDIPSLISLGGGGSVDLLKVDIEGSEAELFSNNVEKWLPSIKNIVIELHGPECEKSFFGALEEYQYEGRPFRSVTVCRNLRYRK